MNNLLYFMSITLTACGMQHPVKNGPQYSSRCAIISVICSTLPFIIYICETFTDNLSCVFDQGAIR